MTAGGRPLRAIRHADSQPESGAVNTIFSDFPPAMDEKQYISVIPYSGSGDLLTDARTIIDNARQYAYSAVNVALVQRNWLLGKRISEEELKEDGRAGYGMEIIKNLSRKLTDEYGKGFSATDLYWCVRFYKAWPEIFASVSKKLFHPFLGRITASCCRLRTRKPVSGICTRLRSRPGASEPSNATFPPNTIIGSFSPSAKTLWRRKCLS